ncbi:hypothetical protein [Faecalibacter bovis]|uniref:DUF4834 family protein n=1 Tax=Faecalibacter bovis TaxID=2898187 RepID=A0ABX7X9U3_9FLAO|nr:hypothetical protein [Faecalibacter bovis]QTV04646.1 hypothetical protein J9309_07420 [Faecalibacter bovis]
MKTIVWIIILGIIFLFVFRFVRKILMIKKAFKDAINQSQQFGGQYQQNNTYDTGNSNQRKSNTPIEQSKYNIEAETVDFEIIEEKNEK